MSIAARILWIDNDPALLYPWQKTLETNGYHVTISRTVSEAANLLTDGSYDLVIIDVMMPTTENDEAEGYSPELTDDGRMTGLAFYVRNRDLLLTLRLPIMVMTVRFDQDILDEFVAVGLPPRCFVTKMVVRNPMALLEKVRSTLAAGTD